MNQHPMKSERFQEVPVNSAIVSATPHDKSALYVTRLTEQSNAAETRKQDIAAAVAIAVRMRGQ
jgi:hypothetical protein